MKSKTTKRVTFAGDFMDDEPPTPDWVYEAMLEDHPVAQISSVVETTVAVFEKETKAKVTVATTLPMEFLIEDFGFPPPSFSSESWAQCLTVPRILCAVSPLPFWHAKP